MRVVILRILNRRSLIILDEPTYGVDSENLPQLMNYFSEAAKKLEQTILVTHYGLGEEEAANIIKVSIGPDGSSTASRPYLSLYQPSIKSNSRETLIIH